MCNEKLFGVHLKVEVLAGLITLLSNKMIYSILIFN